MEDKKAKKELVVYDEARLEANAKLGMSKVDPADIRPPQILLVQKSSDIGALADKQGHTPNVGQFFHTGRNEIMDTFGCYFLYAEKSRYHDRRKPEEPEKDQYKALGVMADDFSLFGMTFRSSALYTLSRLFSSAVSQKKPMYCFLCIMEAKMLTGEKGDWFIPVLRISGVEANAERLIFLEDLARSIDTRSRNEEPFDVGDVDEVMGGDDKNG
jgi:hypothetical protein